LPHVIRLRAPWDIEPLTEQGLVRCTRHFNKPTGLDHGERVWLVIEGAASSARITVNGSRLGQTSCLAEVPMRIDITQLITGRNRLEIELSVADGHEAAQFQSAVRLEIE